MPPWNLFLVQSARSWKKTENEAGSTLQLLSLSASNCLFFGGFFGAGGLPRKKLSSGSKAKENI